MKWKKRAASLAFAVAVLGGAGVVASTPAAAATCSSMNHGPVNDNTWEFVASCSGGAKVYSSVFCWVPGSAKSKTVTFPSTGGSMRWTITCTYGADSGSMHLIN